MSREGPWDTVGEALAALDEAGRPKAPPLDVSDMERANGHHLAAIHRMHLGELSRVRRLMASIRTGEVPPQALAEAIPNMEMARNYQAFGNLCGRACMILNGHHNIEEYDMFPRVEAGGNASVNAVVRKLRDEHKIVHALIERLYAAAVALVRDADGGAFEEAEKVFDQFEAVVKSHFGYEERELEEAIGKFHAL